MRLPPCLLCVPWLLAASSALAQPAPILKADPPAWATLAHPLRLDVPSQSEASAPIKPVWTKEGLLAGPPMGLRGLAKTAHSGIPTWDPASQAWYASAEGSLVRVETDGSLTVVVDGVQGVDVDFRASKGVAVSREPDDTIVLWRVGGAKRVLLSGPQFFRPRFSPDGAKILVAESRAEGGHSWLVDLDGKATDLGQSYFATWHPDGKSVVFVRVVHDGYVIQASAVYSLDLAARREKLLARTQAPALVEPAVSPDGRFVAFRAAQEDAVLVAPLAAQAGEGR
ncbi:MAG TPA: hypothetical protein VGK67_41455 [Myxococcales bacterium]|jgi:hypothetical protein